LVDVDTSIVDRLIALKAKSGMSALEISAKSRVPESTVTRILQKKTVNPTITTVVAIYKAMGGTAAEIFGDDVRVNIVSEASPTSKDATELIQLYKDTIKAKDRTIKMLAVALAAVVVFVLIIFLIGVLNGVI
jgi:transcriptional regulator with XRE-family HTH domain